MPLFKRLDHVIEDQLISLRVGSERGVQFLNTRRRRARCLEARFANDERVSEGALGRLTLWFDRETNGPELHRRDRMVSVTPLRGRSQSDDIARLDLFDDTLIGDRGHMVAFVDDDLDASG